ARPLVDTACPGDTARATNRQPLRLHEFNLSNCGATRLSRGRRPALKKRITVAVSASARLGLATPARVDDDITFRAGSNAPSDQNLTTAALACLQEAAVVRVLGDWGPLQQLLQWQRHRPQQGLNPRAPPRQQGAPLA
ncbi:hypothetical protein ACFXKG_40790, partial [Streptomyces sp. NPDC059255]|uniref:hypothetical protein n=1 Tax=Streptomyces sp. NPDC059255 TaxID=3346793 RepID=UPI0036A9830D